MVYVSFIDFEMYDIVMEAVWQVLSGKLLNRIKSMYIDSQVCVRVK